MKTSLPARLRLNNPHGRSIHPEKIWCRHSVLIQRLPMVSIVRPVILGSRGEEGQAENTPIHKYYWSCGRWWIGSEFHHFVQSGRKVWRLRSINFFGHLQLQPLFTLSRPVSTMISSHKMPSLRRSSKQWKSMQGHPSSAREFFLLILGSIQSCRQFIPFRFRQTNEWSLAKILASKKIGVRAGRLRTVSAQLWLDYLPHLSFHLQLTLWLVLIYSWSVVETSALSEIILRLSANSLISAAVKTKLIPKRSMILHQRRSTKWKNSNGAMLA